MCKLKRFLPQNILRILYNSLIQPHLQYAVLSWGFKKDRLYKLQKKLIEFLHAVGIMPILNASSAQNWRYHENKIIEII